MKAPHYKYTFFLQLVFCFFLISISNSCNRKQVASSSNNEKTSTDQPQLLYLTIESVIDSITGNPNMKIIRQQLVNGQLKGDAEVELTAGSWQISLLNAKGKRVDSLVMTDPHIQDMEYMKENGEFSIRKIRYIRTEIPLRFNYSSSVKEIEVIELGEDVNKKPFFRVKLIL
jgi:hypothetical protein